jgi:hypothetical protein
MLCLKGNNCVSNQNGLVSCCGGVADGAGPISRGLIESLLLKCLVSWDKDRERTSDSLAYQSFQELVSCILVFTRDLLSVAGLFIC